MQEQTSGKSGNFILFMLLTFGVVMLHSWFFGVNRKRPQPAPPKPVAAAKAEPGKEAAKPAAEKKDGKDKEADKPDKPAEAKEPKEEAPAEPEPPEVEEPPAGETPVPKPLVPQKLYTIGSADPSRPYRMLVTATDRAAAVVRVELNSPEFPALMDDNGCLDEDDGYLAYTGGYLGRLTVGDDKLGKGCPVEVVGRGTPAEKAGLKPGDLITEVAGQKVISAKSFYRVLAKKKPGRKVDLVVLRGRKQLKLQPQLTRPPMEVMRPEGDDPLSFLMTLSQIDKKKLAEAAVDKDQPKDKRPVYVDKELKGLNLRAGTWEVVNHSEEQIQFRCKLPRWGLEVLKTYRLEPIPAANQNDPNYRAYHLVLDVTIRNTGRAKRTVAYQLDGPTGLPIEGWWYANKVGRCWSAGLRDVVVLHNGQAPGMVGCVSIAGDTVQETVWQDLPEASLAYIGVDAQYFSAVLIPQRKDPSDTWFATSQPLRVGPVKEKIKQITDVTCRLRSQPVELTPDGEPLSHTFTVFTGPKRPEIVSQYGLDELIYYGWYGFVARPMVSILHFFYGIVRNYGLAILMLTVLVRGVMFPMSRKQVLGAQKMAELQPELKRLKEKHKKDMEAFGKAQRELFAKHRYNPLSGCLVMFVQLPIFIGLYRGLMVDIELRGSPLLWSGLRWCSNLSAPDMLLDWHNLLPAYFTKGIGTFVLGPYFNLLPLATIVLFLLQQKMFMPPPADEQQAMQQNIMKYMMIFIGIMFFKVASGLCVYFIASSLWGLAERRWMPKAAVKDGGNGAAGAAKAKRPGPRK